MNLAENDNYNPQIMELEKNSTLSNGWLSSNMAQLMVFANGLILTITAFATLNIFISEIIKDDLTQISNETSAQIYDGYNSIENYLDSLKIILSQNKKGEFTFTPVMNDFYSSIQGLKYLYIYDHKLNKTYEAIGEAEQSSVIRKALDQYAKSLSQKIYVIPGGENGSVFIKKKIFSDKSKKNLKFSIIASIDFDMLIEKNLKKYDSMIKEIIITGISDHVQLYRYGSSDEVSNQKIFFNVNEMQLGLNKYEIRHNLSISDRQDFLQKIPFLMLLFGFTLTLIGTLYVRSNQQQSRKLASMNRKLAHKNYEINNEMLERERLTKVIQKAAIENRSIINAVSDIIVELSSDGKIVFLNDSWVKVTGFELDQSIGRNFFDLLHRQDQYQEEKSFNSFIKGHKESYRSYVKLRSASGLFRAIELSISMTRYDENNNMRIVGTITDVEERRRAEKALSEAEKKYRTIVENAAGGIYQVTPEGQYLSANPAFAKILGYEQAEEVLHNVHDAHEKIYLNTAERIAALNAVKTSQKPISVETQIIQKDSNIIWVYEDIRPVFDDEGNLLFFEGSMTNINQRKIAELALIDAKLESDLANRSKSEFLANMSHELRTPLNSIIGFSDIIQSQAYGEIKQPEYLEHAKSINNSGNKLLRVINDILDVSQIEAGERELREGLFNVADVINDTLSLMETKITDSKIRFENKVLKKDFKLIAEKQAVKQMLINLLSNAIKFSADSSLVIINCDIDEKSRLHISISDTGIGLTEDEIHKAMSPFGQIESDHSKSISGTGLGLTLVRSLIDLHGGELDMISQKGIGTTVTLIFPDHRVPPCNKHGDSNKASAGTSGIQNVQSAD